MVAVLLLAGLVCAAGYLVSVGLGSPIREPMNKRTVLGLGAAGLGLFLAIWLVLTEGGIIPEIFLPSPLAVLKSFKVLHLERGLTRSIMSSFLRVTSGFLLAAVVAVPLGILAGTFPRIRALLQPISTPLRYLPIAALLPVCFLMFSGLGKEAPNVMLLFIGIAVYMFPMVVESVERVEEVYLNTAYTLGATKWQTLRHVIIPSVLPEVFDTIRVMNGIGWTYVILAELSELRPGGGLGGLILSAQRRHHLDWVFAGVVVILLMGFLTDRMIAWVNKQLFHWKEVA